MTGVKYQAFAGLQPYVLEKEETHLQHFEFEPKPLEDDEVEIEISACGICGTDIHHLTNGWKRANYPLVPGHECIGKITTVGAGVKHLKVGDRVGVSPVRRTCGDCVNCNEEYGQYCDKKVATYNGSYEGYPLHGGYANKLRVQADWAIPIPDNIKDEEGAPLLCAGITTYLPFKQNNIGKGASVGIMGIGGLGHLAVQWARAKGCDNVLAISTSERKREDASKLGATDFLILDKDGGFDSKYIRTLDYLLVCGSGENTKWDKLASLIKPRGKLILIDIPEQAISIAAFSLCYVNISLEGTFVGGKEALKEMLEFASEHNVRPWISTVENTLEGVNQGVKDLINGKAHYRIVISGVGR